MPTTRVWTARQQYDTEAGSCAVANEINGVGGSIYVSGRMQGGDLISTSAQVMAPVEQYVVLIYSERSVIQPSISSLLGSMESVLSMSVKL